MPRPLAALSRLKRLHEPSGMPTVLRIKGYRFFFVSLDRGEPPHIHVRREKKVAKIWLQPVSVAKRGGFTGTEINKIIKLVDEHRQLILEKWHEFFSR